MYQIVKKDFCSDSLLWKSVQVYCTVFHKTLKQKGNYPNMLETSSRSTNAKILLILWLKITLLLYIGLHYICNSMAISLCKFALWLSSLHRHPQVPCSLIRNHHSRSSSATLYKEMELSFVLLWHGNSTVNYVDSSTNVIRERGFLEPVSDWSS